MRKALLVSFVLLLLVGSGAFADNPWENSFNYPPPPSWYGPGNDEQPQEVPYWIRMSIRNQIAKRFNQEFGAEFHIFYDDKEDPDAFFIDAVGPGGDYWAYVTMKRLPTPKSWSWSNKYVFKIDGYGVGNGEPFWAYGMYSSSKGLNIKVYK